MFGLYTKTQKNSGDTSQIRWGGYNKGLFKKNIIGKIAHDVIWFPTVSSVSWKLPASRIDFNRDHILNKPTFVLFNPGFPFISAPVADFQRFQKDIKEIYSKKPLICTTYDWCYFEEKCSKVAKKLKPLKFKIGSDSDAEYFSVPPESYLFDQEDPSYN